MDAANVLEVLERLSAAGIRPVLDGGWGVDALLGEQTRHHDDLDVVLARAAAEPAERALGEIGFQPLAEVRPGLPARLVLRRAEGDRRVDLHLVVFDRVGNGWQELPGGGWGLYGREHLRAHGLIAGHRVRCVTAELQLQHHLGFALTDTDRHDLRQLAARFGIPVPPELGRKAAQAESRSANSSSGCRSPR